MATNNTDLSGTRGSLSLPADLPPSIAGQRRLDDRLSSLEQGHNRSSALRVDMTYGAGWDAYGLPYKGLGVVRSSGLIVLTGMVKRSSGVGTTICTLPVGYRPAAGTNNGAQLLFSVATDAGPGRVDITSAGVVTYVAGGTTWLSLSGIVFPL